MTISMRNLGSNGRLGNQMFQYAGLRGLAAQHNYNWQIPSPETYGRSNYGLFDCFKMDSVAPNNFGQPPGQTITSGCFHFNEQFFNNLLDDVDISDYFQTEKYFSHISDIIRSDFQFKDDILKTCKEVLDEIENPIFMHVRRGDYLNCSDFHPFVGMDYYKKALELFPKDVTVLLFSDDIAWCKTQEFFNGDQFMHSDFDARYNQSCDTNNGLEKSLIPYYDLCMMSLCKGGVIANSTMSWWAAWLMDNPSLPIITPTPWFGPKSNDNTVDLIPTRWTKLER